MPEPVRPRRWMVIADWVRALVGPIALLYAAASQGVRVTGPLTVALAYPRPPATLVAADVLAVGALTVVALFGAAALMRCRAPAGRFLLPVASAQLPMALVALLVGRATLAETVVRVVRGHEERLLSDPGPLVTPLLLSAGLALLLAIGAAAILFRGYSRATGARGWRLWVGFIGGVVAAELICRVWLRFAG